MRYPHSVISAHSKGQMQRAKSICRVVGCGALIPSPGYCDKHKSVADERFSNLRKAPDSRAFYGSRRWTRTSLAYRRQHPLCEDHLDRGLVVKGDLTDHKVERLELVAQGLSPYDFEYLQTLCHSCHNRKLRARKNKMTEAYTPSCM